MNDAESSLEDYPIVATAEMRRKAGHQEILGETLAKFEFFQHGWHPYSRFLDVDKIDLLLRRRRGVNSEYREVQVKFGKLYECTKRWERGLFDYSSWRFFKESSLNDLEVYPNLYLAYVLAPDDGFKSDMFIFKIRDFVRLIRQSDKLGDGSYRVYISRSIADSKKWFLRRRNNFDHLGVENVVDVSQHYRDFSCLL